MQKLNLPAYDFLIRRDMQSSEIFDAVRKKYVALTPEEWVRQHTCRYLSEELGYPAGLMALEYGLQYNEQKKRCDIVLFSRERKPLMIVECKAPSVSISEKTFEQIARYNFTLRVPYLLVTNGMNNYCCKISFETQSFQFLEKVPLFEEMI